MEIRSPVSPESAQQERPTTRWRREEIPFTRVSVIDDSQKSASEDSAVPGKQRPTSRRGIMARQGPTSSPADERLYTRPTTASRSSALGGGRPPSARHRVAMPGTASRLSSVGPPPSRSGTATSMAGTSVVERPITQQGLTGLRPGSRGPPVRNVQDKRYFEGLLQMKVRNLTDEVTRLDKENDGFQREQSTFLVYDARVKEMAAELTELQGSLADYNLVVDKCNTDTEKGDIDAECLESRGRNEAEGRRLEELFSSHKDREAEIRRLEGEVERERHATDDLLAAMDPALSERYRAARGRSAALQAETDALQRRLDGLADTKAGLEDRVATSHVKREAVHLHLRLHEAEHRRTALAEEERSRATPAQERETLLRRVREDNAEMATMERQVADLRDEARRRREELDQIEQDLDESQSERHQKFRELRRREETMEQFLATFRESYDREMGRIRRMEEDVVTALRQMSHNIGLGRHLPSVEEYSAMKETLSYQEGELDKSKKTVDGLSKEQSQLQNNLQKVEELEEKIKVEMETLRQRMAVMSEEMVTLTDLDTLGDQVRKKRATLEAEREALAAKQQPTKDAVEAVKQKHSQLKKQLDDNETHAQLSNLERKLALLEQNNFAIQEFIAAKKTETAYEPTKVHVLEMVTKLNTNLKETLKATT